MASIKDLKKRIGTVKNTQQTTRAMKMVSAAKLRRAQEAITAHRPYAKRVGELIAHLSSAAGHDIKSPRILKLIGKGEDGPPEGGKRLLLIVVTSDRGLCGGFNGSVIKTAQRWIASNRSNYGAIELGFVGRRGGDFFKSRKIPLSGYYSVFGGKVTFAKAKKLSESLLEWYLEGKYDEIKFIFNEFKNAVTQRVIAEDFLPIAGVGGQEGSQTETASEAIYIVKPSAPEVLEELVGKNFAIQTFRILLESQAGEHGARMSAMENATKNAGEMIRKLALQYNRQRQAGITKELLEIISGSESQKTAS